MVWGCRRGSLGRAATGAVGASPGLLVWRRCRTENLAGVQHFGRSTQQPPGGQGGAASRARSRLTARARGPTRPVDERRTAKTDRFTLPPEQSRGRPLRLLGRPQPIDVTSIVPDGPPIRMVWKRQDCLVVRSWGPERIATGWWRRRTSSATITAPNGRTARRYGSIATSATVAGFCTAFSTDVVMPEQPPSKLYVPAPVRDLPRRGDTAGPLCRASLQDELLVPGRGVPSRRAGRPGGQAWLCRDGGHRSKQLGGCGPCSRRRQGGRSQAGRGSRSHAGRCQPHFAVGDEP